MKFSPLRHLWGIKMRQSKYGINIKQRAAELGIAQQVFYQRIKRGWSVEDALSKSRCPKGNHTKKYNFDVKEVAEKLGVAPVTIYNRIKQYGYSVEKACSVGKYGSYKYVNNNHLNESLARLNCAVDRLLALGVNKARKIIREDIGTDFRKLKAKWITEMSEEQKDAAEYACGGFKITVLNHVKDKEFIYNVVGTDGKNLHTNDKAEFMAFMAEVA